MVYNRMILQCDKTYKCTIVSIDVNMEGRDIIPKTLGAMQVV